MCVLISQERPCLRVGNSTFGLEQWDHTRNLYEFIQVCINSHAI
jgi:hypothetical protein